MKKKIWSWVITVLAYSVPVVVGLVITQNPNVLWGYVPMICHFLLFWWASDVYYNNQAGRKGVGSALMALFLGVMIAVIFSILPHPGILWLTLGQFIVSWIVHAMISEE